MFNFGEVDSLDAVPAEFKSVYSTTPNAAGKYEVAAGFKPMVTAYQGQATALEAERGKVRTLNTENATRRAALKPYEDLVAEFGITVEGDDIPTALKTHVANLTTKVAGGEAFKGNLAKIKEETEKRIAELTRTKDAELAAMQGTLSEYLIDREALAALSAEKAKNGGKVLLPHVQSKLKVVKDENGKYTVRAVDEKGDVRFNSAAQPMGVADIVKEVKASPDYAFAFESDTAGGIGTKPGDSRTPVQRPNPEKGELSSTQKITAGLDAMTKK